MPTPLDIITGQLLSNVNTLAPNQRALPAFSPTLGPSAAPRGRSPVSSPTTEVGQPPTPDVPNLFGRPTAGPVFQASDPIAPPPPPPPAPPPAGPSPSVITQALMLQNILGGLGSTGLQPLWGLGGQTDPVYLQSVPAPGLSSPFGGWASGNPASQYGWGQWQPWSQSPGYSALGPWGTGIQQIHPGMGPGTWAHSNPYSYQSGQGWQLNPGYTSHQMAMQNSLAALAPELQGLAPIQALFNAPILGGSGGGGIYSGTTQGVPGPGTGGSGTAAGAWHPGGVSPMVNAAIQALSQWLMGQGT